MVKKRVNWTLMSDIIVLLERVQKASGKGYAKQRSISELVEHAVRNTYLDPVEEKRQEAKNLQIKLKRLVDEIDDLEEQRSEPGFKAIEIPGEIIKLEVEHGSN